jgi:uracil-DNA glycosylase family 4
MEMTLDLDDRHRAMLAEMGVRVWLPGPASAVQPEPVRTVAVEQAPARATAVPAAREPQPVRAESAEAFTARQPAPAAPTRVATPVPVGALDLQTLDWSALAEAAATCQACALCSGRKNTTLLAPTTAGQCDWMVVGDPPDEDEDRAGQPFAEAAGQLLDNMLKAMGASRSGSGATGVYLSNVVKCRPPQARIPQAVELAQCAAFLQREIALVRPKVILAMGRFANQVLLGEQPELAALPLGKLRGTVYRYQGVAVVPTYHPRVLLRAPADKAKAWADLCLAMDARSLQ